MVREVQEKRGREQGAGGNNSITTDQ